MEINDVFIQAIEWKSGRITLVKESDPLLRRFGQCDFIELEEGKATKIFRNQADEVWFVLEEEARFELMDLREDSPSFETQQTVELTADTPQTILIPFGVSCKISTGISRKARLLRLTTHQDDTDPGDLIP